MQTEDFMFLLENNLDKVDWESKSSSYLRE